MPDQEVGRPRTDPKTILDIYQGYLDQGEPVVVVDGLCGGVRPVRAVEREAFGRHIRFLRRAPRLQLREKGRTKVKLADF